MKRFGYALTAACFAALAVAGPASLAEELAQTSPSAAVLLARAMDSSTAPQCTAGSANTKQCGSIYTRVAAGSECPATSGKYCSDKLPYCCGTPGNYYCAKDVNGC